MKGSINLVPSAARRPAHLCVLRLSVCASIYRCRLGGRGYKSDFTLATHGVLTALLVLFTFSTAFALDEWVQVASGGLGDARRIQPDAIAIHRGYVYVSSSSSSGGGSRPFLFRAPLHEDDAWEDVTPPWTFDGQVSGMVLFRNQLHVSKSNDEIWRLGFDDVWVQLDPEWTNSSTTLAIGVMQPSMGVSRLCAVRNEIQFEIWCGHGDTGWAPLSLPVGIDDAEIGSAVVEMFNGDFYVGLGTFSNSDDTPCRLWKLTSVRNDPSTGDILGDWVNVTRDCFGRNLCWIPSLEVVSSPFPGYLYIGTGGHADFTVVMRTNGRTVEDVTPRDLYAFTPFSRAPVRFGAMATIEDLLFAGTRTSEPPPIEGLADVISTRGEGSWSASNEPGFGSSFNDTLTALGSFDSYLYAGVLNTDEGFEVWRRTPDVGETLPFLFRHYREMFAIRIPLVKCLLPFDPNCGFDFSALQEELSWIQLGVDRSRFNNKILQQDSIAALNQAGNELFNAQLEAGLAKKAETIKEAQTHATRAVHHLDQGLQITYNTLVKIKTGNLP